MESARLLCARALVGVGGSWCRSDGRNRVVISGDRTFKNNPGTENGIVIHVGHSADNISLLRLGRIELLGHCCSGEK